MWETTHHLPRRHLSTSSVEVFVIQLNKVASTGEHQTSNLQDGELGLGLWRVYDFILHIDSKWICIELHMSGAVGISFVTKAFSRNYVHFLSVVLCIIKI